VPARFASAVDEWRFAGLTNYPRSVTAAFRTEIYRLFLTRAEDVFARVAPMAGEETMSIVTPEPTHAADGFARSTPEEHRVTDSLYDGDCQSVAPANPNSPEPADHFYGLSVLTNAIDQRGAELWAETGATEAQ
jgi:hypothetical protein